MNTQTSHLLEITTDNCEGERVWKIFCRSILKKYFENTILFCIWNTFWKVFYFVIFKILSKSILHNTALKYVSFLLNSRMFKVDT